MAEIRAADEYGDGVSWFRGSIIGKGAFGTVYSATLKNPTSKYSSFPSLMAVKSAEVSLSGSIQKEREILGNVRGCPYIIRCFGEETTVGASGAMVYNLLLEYGSGGTLAGRIRASNGGRGLPEHEVRSITRSILKGLSHIHGLGYVHCDLKPSNILLVNGGSQFRAKIGDFGQARRAGRSRKRKLGAYWRGTPMYLSPEAVLENEQEGPSDLWALGCIVLEMLTGKPPWATPEKESSAKEIVARVGLGREVPWVPAGLSKEARDFLKGCFVRKPEFRLTAEMLLNHPFVEGLDAEDDGDDEVDEVEDVDELESILLVSDSDDELVTFDLSGYWSGDENEIIMSNISEERELKVIENGGLRGSEVDVEFDRPNKKLKEIRSQVYPVSFKVPAGV
ncbi:mitogen-activated protein kinase kinase kinase 21 [Striga hermonthica]|uniref:Mitogen-activated protein kinase kinase kinase 21 n=1 Tax=Striga hermonthica TaxID=68872 RepID=A0A9N7P2R9_STRHE|nr:mitogen-activated protein kinase kinase kinase 21 [Striga hermonthica]